ncbi:universal stress protein [Flavobacterium salilacus subsp. salilacus]|uniref:universal stress protein n=1 Tax=Flavobacterium TaxID=237 RepID=UPI001074A25B|nr:MULTISPECIES: universal stress protein [Flavobacterium]KAF2520023.1 universal stress protein [Flavobacterium salilacus subsp. salilacus]MBE1614061.1 universal stress protein [Flavobacterium sp. SaA2.13]NDI97852.1 universal stress protein [Flavobacterium salilacus subsp. altitudinum]
MKKILVPTDFSEHAEYALKVAAQIARKNNGEIFLLHLLELPNHVADGVGESNAVGASAGIPEVMFFMKKVRERFEEVVNAPYLQGIKVVEAIQFEKAFDGIMKHSKDHGIDLIVMGSHGASGFREMFIGSNTEKVVRTSNVPVLVIKKDEGEFTPQKFVFASDFSKEIKEPFAKVVEFANAFDMELDLVYINTPNDFKSTHAAEKLMQEFVAGFNINNLDTYIYNDVNVEKGILHFANSINADMIGMCTHGRQGLAHFFNGSISEDLVNHAVRPVVTFKI